MSTSNNTSIDQILDDSLNVLGNNPTAAAVEKALTTLKGRLTGASSLRRKLAFNGACKKLMAIGVDDPKGLIDTILGGGGSTLLFNDIEPWPEVVDAADLLDRLQVFLTRFVVFSKTQAAAVALWIMMTWMIDAVQTAPLLVISAPEKRCGKTTLLGLLKVLVRRPLQTSNITAPALFRTIDQCHPTLLIDEADSFVKDNEELRGILNAGHTPKTAFVIRMVSVDSDFEARQFSVWGAKAVALIGRLPGTLEDRSIIIRMRRQLPHERSKAFRERDFEKDIQVFNAQLARFAMDVSPYLENWEVDIPSEITNDRARDNWQPLLALGEIAGGCWGEIACRAAVQMTSAAVDTDQKESRGVQVLRDIRDYFQNTQESLKVSTDVLLTHLCGLKERPWTGGDIGQASLTSRELAGLLDPYGIEPKTIRIGSDTLRGYERASFHDAFIRYLPEAATSATSATNANS
jgi:hypothetical protein